MQLKYLVNKFNHMLQVKYIKSYVTGESLSYLHYFLEVLSV